MFTHPLDIAQSWHRQQVEEKDRGGDLYAPRLECEASGCTTYEEPSDLWVIGSEAMCGACAAQRIGELLSVYVSPGFTPLPGSRRELEEAKKVMAALFAIAEAKAP